MKRFVALSIAGFASAGAVAGGIETSLGAQSSAVIALTAARASVEQTFDRNKGRFYAIYVRALKENPKLAGKVVLDIDIGTAGNVTDCRVVSSQLPAHLGLEFCDLVRQFRFGAQESPATHRKPLDFFPAL